MNQPKHTPNANPPIRVVVVNEIAAIATSISPALTELNFSIEIVGRTTFKPRNGNSRFLSTTGSILRSLTTIRHSDILHVNYGLFGLTRLAAPHVPSVLHLHGSDVRPASGIKGELTNFLSRVGANFADRVWYSTSDLGRIVDGLGISASFMPSPVAQSFFALSGGLPREPRVLFAVPLSRTKGAELAISAMNEISARAPEIQLSAFGFGPSLEEAQNLRSQIPRNVQLIPWTDHELMPALLSGFRLIIGQLGLGVLGVTELESMAVGRPVVTQLSRNTQTFSGYYESEPPVISCQTSSDITDRVATMIHNDSSLTKMGIDSRSWVKRYHSPGVVARLYAAEYRKLVNEREN